MMLAVASQPQFDVVLAFNAHI